MPYRTSGTLTSSKLEIDDSDGWDTQTEWAAYQSKNQVVINSGVLELEQYNYPASVNHAYPYATFGSTTWTDDVGTVDMTVNGMTAATFSNGSDSVSGDGTDDYGLVNNGPRNLPSNTSFGIALTMQYQNTADGDRFFGAADASANNRFWLMDGDFHDSSLGELKFWLSDDGNNALIEETDNVYDDGNPHAVIINKTSDTNVDIYVDSMSTPVASTTHATGFSASNYSPSNTEFAFYAQSADGTIGQYSAFDAGIFEFNTDTYSEAERNDFVSRRPEV